MRRPSWETSAARIMLSSQKGSLAAEHLSQEKYKFLPLRHFLPLYARSNFTSNVCVPSEAILSKTFYVKEDNCKLFSYLLDFLNILVFDFPFF